MSVVLTKIRYIAGWNTPGYLPETMPEEFNSYEDAIRYLAETVERFWDDFHSDGTGQKRQNADEEFMPIHVALHNAIPAYDDGTHTFGMTSSDTHYWITPKC